MRSVDKRINAPVIELGDDAFDREHKARLAGDMIDQNEPGPGRHPREEGIDNLGCGANRERNPGNDRCRTGSVGNEVESVSAGVVFVVSYQQFVARGKRKRTQDGVDARGGVGNENKIIGTGAEKPCQLRACRVEEGFQILDKEGDRLFLHPLLNLALEVDHRAGTASEGPVI